MKKLINDLWEYAGLPFGSTMEDAAGCGRWQRVDLPHDWLIWREDLYETADAWYRRTLSFPENPPPTVLVRFDGVYMDCDVLFNGTVVSVHRYGYTAFTVDLSGAVRGGDNELMVHIRHRSPNSRWYSGSGIFRDVHLMTLPEDYVVPYSLYLTGKPCGEDWNVRISVETKGKDGIPFRAEILDPDGRTAAETEAASMDGKAEVTLTVPKGRTWSVRNPERYTLRTCYQGESGEIRFGLRSVCLDPDHGFFLNGEHIKLKGVCLHHDLGCLGAAFHEKAARRQLQLMKDMGANALRTSHNPPAEKLLDLCDEMGILVIDEAFDMWERPKTEFDYARFFPEQAHEDVASWVRRDRNHPSVVMWSVGNEIYDMHADERGTEVCRMLMEQVHLHDPEHNGTVTFGCNYMPWEGGQRCAEVVKVPGYNYGEKLYAEHHAKHPDWVIYGSETASVLSSRGVYHFPIENSIMSEADQQCSALGNSNTSWGAEDLKSMIVDDLKCEYSMGQFIWSGIDYIGEPTPYHTRSCYFGQADTACFPKDPYYLFQSLWSDRQVLHIGVSWDWNPGQMIDVPVMTNCASAELFVNGRSAGKKQVSGDDPGKCLPVWKIPYEAGEIRAAGYDASGKIIAEDRRLTPGDTARFGLEASDETILSDGDDIVFVTVTALDSADRPVENARDRVRITVEGGGCLMGTDNGDSTDPDSYKSACRRLFNGKLLLVAGSTGRKEPVRIRVENSEGISSEISIGVRDVPVKEGCSRIQRIPDGRIPGQESVRKIELVPQGDLNLTKENPECVIRWKALPENAQVRCLKWQVTNAAGIETPFAEAREKNGTVRVSAAGDGFFYLRALAGDSPDRADIISQIEIRAEGIGNPALNPYESVSAGLYDLHEGDIGTGNEKGIAFARDGESMVGFSRVDFGASGSDTLILPIFALDGKPYEIELFDGDPRKDGKRIDVLHYEKPSIWNVYQEETYHLPQRLTGMKTLCFRMRQKVHMKSFRFERQNRAFLQISAGSADEVYGDSFRVDGDAVKEIGNNVTLTFRGMDFGGIRRAILRIEGATPHAVNAVTVRFTGADGKTLTGIADFLGNGGEAQEFPMDVPGGPCTVSFVFLPGSLFDFKAFRFIPAAN